MDELERWMKDTGTTQVALADALGCVQGMVWQILRGRRECPARMVMQIEALTGGRVTRKHLRPDDWHVYWPDPAREGEAPTKVAA